MKTRYMKPSVTWAQLDANRFADIINTSSSSDSDPGRIIERRNRGEWGDLWYVEPDVQLQDQD